MTFFKILGNKKTIAVLFLIFVGFNIYFSNALKGLNDIATAEVKILDLTFGYSFEEINLFFEQIGSEGILLYQKISFVDMFYPVFYGLFIMSLISFFAKENSKFLLLNVLPVIMILLDFIENISIGKLCANYPNINSEMVTLTSSLTLSKWFFVGLSIVSVLFLLSRSLFLKTKKVYI